MKPGATTRSEASITFFAPSAALPISTIRPSAIATSARRDGPPVPSTTVPFLISRSYDIRGFLPLPSGKAPQGQRRVEHDDSAITADMFAFPLARIIYGPLPSATPVREFW